eukprot:TRINITY_DN16386_c0_g1_i3.p1 TRINITY_DN16386_c0_g1~~TRINITY_DN16386_c0_g1_i3.p1  ORF type:complete len:242 (-),score=67.50 TRINITY_DN16386_c0_g1_i3:386-1111(-)
MLRSLVGSEMCIRDRCTPATRVHGSEIPFPREYKTVKEVGELPLGGQVKGGPFFTGDSSDKPQLQTLPSDATVGMVLNTHAERTARRVAVDGGGIKWTFEELKDHVDGVCRGVMELGVGSGSSVAIMNIGPAERLCLDLAAARLGFSLVECGQASQLSDAVTKGAKLAVFDCGSDSAAASTVAGISCVKLQTSGTDVPGAHGFHDVLVYGPLFPDPLDSIPGAVVPDKYKDLVAGTKISLA